MAPLLIWMACPVKRYKSQDSFSPVTTFFYCLENVCYSAVTGKVKQISVERKREDEEVEVGSDWNKKDYSLI